MSEFSSDINKLALKNFYETHKEEYFKRRNSGDKKLWDEQYKWDILPRLNKELAEFDKITKDNVGEFISIITQNKNKSNFANWRDAVDLISIFSKPNGYHALNETWTSSQDNNEESINSANDMTELFTGEKYWSLNDSALYLNRISQEDKDNNGTYSQTALNGQDFL